jgi:adenosylhomocysteine nucleosidase
MKKVISIILLVCLLSVAVFAEGARERDVPRVGIISAMSSELNLLKDKTAISYEKQIAGETFYVGTLQGKEVVLVKAGVGKALAAMYAGLLADNFNVNKIIFTGIAGGVGDQTKPLDVVIATELVQHDYGTETNNGFVWSEYQIGVGEKGTFIPIDDELEELAFQSAVSVGNEMGFNAYKGVIVTGDQFIASETYVKTLQDNFNALACEMEGASVALVAYRFGIPCIIIRSMSDKADGLAHDAIESFGQRAADYSANVVLNLLTRF